MKKALTIIAIALLLVLLAAGCGKKVEIKIEDTQKPAVETPVKPVFDGKCDTSEDCEFSECKESFPCRKLALNKDEYLLQKDMSEKIGGKTLTFVNLDSGGKISLKVDGITRVVETTKFKEIINGLEVTVLESKYSTNSDELEIKILSKPYVPGPDEYFFEKEGSEKIIESVRLRLSRVEKSSPNNFVRLDVGDTLNQKVIQGQTKTLEGLSITVVEAHPRGTPTESYAILKVTKA